jgi:hypothetical protein
MRGKMESAFESLLVRTLRTLFAFRQLVGHMRISHEMQFWRLRNAGSVDSAVRASCL